MNKSSKLKMIDPAKWLETTVLAIAGFNLLLVFVKILFTKSQVPKARVFLLSWFFGMGVGMLMMFLMDTTLILNLPWLYRLPSPGYYLIFPAAYFYLRMILTNNSRLTRWDALHLLPAVLHFIELIPFFLKPNAYKVEVLQAVLSKPLGTFAHSEGLLLPHQNMILIGIFGLGYTLAMFRLMYKSKKVAVAEGAYALKMRKLLLVFIGLQVVFAISPIVLLGFPELGIEHLRGTLLYLNLALTQLGAAIIFIFYPNLQNGVQEFIANSPDREADLHTKVIPESPKIPAEIDIENQFSSSANRFNATEQRQQLINRLEEHVSKHQSFLQKELNIADLAKQLGVPTHHLSLVLNQDMAQRFSDYINLKRITYMEERIRIDGLKKYTLETIAIEAGFNTRITFIRALRKLKGSNPKDYFRQVVKPNTGISRKARR